MKLKKLKNEKLLKLYNNAKKYDVCQEYLTILEKELLLRDLPIQFKKNTN
ncbi:sporulation histidine kinase inhibitor Sda [Gracilibacillus sp. S3-1-1]|uniref:Sporulation histidine kinase inhibitor Sda n=1 Tax=Gracilibacillus pellucidus TaxID=3095368 RepID=A0ACC6M8K4_9BACI|nr:sporulation histidine kinase inhibitor Sda [Gracilibacillus sp. S3-1-1]MDX8047228.1 sporulation histidine kinase inhibitor Sda [Gracilibacillus sp. S3-1-1]